MYLARRVRFNAFATVALVLAFAAPAASQDISESHMKAARAAISSIGATDNFDGILPQAAQALKAELIQKNPNLAQLINATVDEMALSLAARRGDLERESATVYARVFTEQQLTEIAQFYESESGKKLLSDGPIVSRQLAQAADIWQRGIARDLARAVGEKIQEVAGDQLKPNPEEGGANQ